MLLALINISMANCFEPKQSVQVETQSRLEGEVKAGIVAFSGGIAGEEDKSTTWAAQLPSQQAIDNQWYLYYLCREYESGHIAQTQYCALSSALWQRITGSAVPIDGCVVTAPPANTIDQPDHSTIIQDQDSSHQIQVPPSPTRTTQTSNRWVGLIPNYGAVEMYGPIELAGISTYIFDNRRGCISKIEQMDNAWHESILLGADCSPWTSIDIKASPDEIILIADKDRIGLEPSEMGFTQWEGSYDGAFFVEKKTVGKVLTSVIIGGPSVIFDKTNITLEIAPNGATIHWLETGCSGSLSSNTASRSFRQYTEHESALLCVSGAIITLQALSSDSLLIEWIPPTGQTQAMGILHRTKEN